MQNPLLGRNGELQPDEDPDRADTFLRYLQMGSASALVGVFGLALFVSFFFKGLDPNTYGIVQNSITGALSDTEAVRGGLHLVGPFKTFLEFPATYQLVELSNYNSNKELGYRKPDRGPVTTRTGADPSDPDSGGQPIAISASFEFVLDPEHLVDIYKSFGSYELARKRYILLGANQISNIAQRFTPQDFWRERANIAETMREGMNATLTALGYAQVPLFQILRIDFDLVGRWKWWDEGLLTSDDHLRQ